MTETVKPVIVGVTEQPTRVGGSGLQVWELVNETTPTRDLLVCYTVIPPGASEGPHERTTDEFLFYLSGTPEVVLTDGTVFSPKPNQLIRIPPGVAHSHRNPGAEPVVQLFFRADAPLASAAV